jgi:hypothetical protein
VGDYEEGGVLAAIDRSECGCPHDPSVVHPTRTFESRPGVGLVMILTCPFDRAPLKLVRI